MKDNYRLIPVWFWVTVAILLSIILSNACAAQQARPTYNPFNNNMMPFYGGNQFAMPNRGFQFPNNTNHPLNFNRPNNFGFQNNLQRPQQQFSPQSQPQYSPQQNNWQRPQVQPQQPTPLPTPLFTRRFHLNNGYLFGRPTLWYDPKSNKAQPWIRKNLR
ncbi:MAG: hypothetical protein H8E05_00730 [Bacteroidetes bacterium]|nr:hypothetical protein [Bacteroidota bacterium]